ncbi:MAG: hypothetical protein ACTSRL_17865 [Candidatus Helarchaeota archaeon]
MSKLVDEEEELRTALAEIDYPLEWFKCLTWSYIHTWATNTSISIAIPPNDEMILKKLLIGNLKGFKDFYINTPLATKNFVLAWSPKRPNVKENIDNRSEQEQANYLQNELKTLITNTDLFYDKLRKILAEDTLKILIADRQRIKLSGKETKEKLILKIENARTYLKKLQNKCPYLFLR